jgi:hypothetical protein
MAKSVRDLAIALFFVILSAALAAGAIGYVQIGLPAYKAAKEAEARAINDVLVLARDAANRFAAAEAQQVERMVTLGAKAEQTSAFFEDIGILVSARFLEEQGALSSAAADEMSRESIANIKTRNSPRVAKLLEAVNDQLLHARR